MDMDDSSAPAAGATETTTTTTTIPLLPPPPRAAILTHTVDDPHKNRLYWDRSHYASPAEQLEALHRSSTLYVGNVSFAVRTRHVRRHFSSLWNNHGAPIRTIILGLDRHKKLPCGFCFVEYVHRRDALAAVALLSGTKLDDRVIRVELDAGFQQGRQYGRGVSGGQVRDDKRGMQDAGRKRSRTGNNSSVPAVHLDGALPSARQERPEATTAVAAAATATAGGEDAMEEDDAAPASKRRKTEA